MKSLKGHEVNNNNYINDSELLKFSLIATIFVMIIIVMTNCDYSSHCSHNKLKDDLMIIAPS